MRHLDRLELRGAETSITLKAISGPSCYDQRPAQPTAICIGDRDSLAAAAAPDHGGVPSAAQRAKIRRLPWTAYFRQYKYAKPTTKMMPAARNKISAAGSITRNSMDNSTDQSVFTN